MRILSTFLSHVAKAPRIIHAGENSHGRLSAADAESLLTRSHLYHQGRGEGLLIVLVRRLWLKATAVQA